MKCSLFLLDKHLYSTSCLNYILELKESCKVNNVANKKCFFEYNKVVYRCSEHSSWINVEAIQSSETSSPMKNAISLTDTKKEIVRIFNGLCEIYYVRILVIINGLGLSIFHYDARVRLIIVHACIVLGLIVQYCPTLSLQKSSSWTLLRHWL